MDYQAFWDFGLRWGGVSFLDTLKGWVGGRLIGADSAVLSTDDGASTWVGHNLGLPFSGGGSIDFVDSLHGWLIAGQFASTVYYSSDGGNNWSEQQGPFSGVIRKVEATDGLHCWVYGNDNDANIWKTSDGGQTWILDYVEPGGYLEDFDMADSTRGIAVGSDGLVLIYTPLVLGDLNGDEEITLSDVVLELNKVFLDAPVAPPEEAADVNCDDNLTPADVVLLLLRAFLGTPFPCSL